MPVAGRDDQWSALCDDCEWVDPTTFHRTAEKAGEVLVDHRDSTHPRSA